MTDVNLDDYSTYASEGLYSESPISPEEDFFHSIYISGSSRINDLGITEKPGLLQVRGIENNLNKVCMIILQTMPVQVKVTPGPDGRGDKTECFSYQDGSGPFKGTSGRSCGKNAAERSQVDYCSTCKNQVIFSGLYCKNDGR